MFAYFLPEHSVYRQLQNIPNEMDQEKLGAIPPLQNRTSAGRTNEHPTMECQRNKKTKNRRRSKTQERKHDK